MVSSENLTGWKGLPSGYPSVSLITGGGLGNVFWSRIGSCDDCGLLCFKGEDGEPCIASDLAAIRSYVACWVNRRRGVFPAYCASTASMAVAALSSKVLIQSSGMSKSELSSAKAFRALGSVAFETSK